MRSTPSTTPAATRSRAPPGASSSACWKMKRISPPGRSRPLKLLRGAEQHRGVPVVAAGVHRAGVLGREVDAALLRDRERVDVGAQRDGRARPAGAQAREHAVLGRALDLEAVEGLERLRHERGGLALLEARLGMAVQMAPPLDDLLLRDLHTLALPRHGGDKAREILLAGWSVQLQGGRRVRGGPGADDPRLVDLVGREPAAELAPRRRREHRGGALRELAGIAREAAPVRARGRRRSRPRRSGRRPPGAARGRAACRRAIARSTPPSAAEQRLQPLAAALQPGGALVAPLAAEASRICSSTCASSAAPPSGSADEQRRAPGRAARGRGSDRGRCRQGDRQRPICP